MNETGRIFNICLMAIWVILTALNCFGSHEATPLLIMLCTFDLLWLRSSYIKIIGRLHVPESLYGANTMSIIAAIAAALNLVVCGVSSYDGIYTICNLCAALLCTGTMLILTSITHKDRKICNES